MKHKLKKVLTGGFLIVLALTSFAHSCDDCGAGGEYVHDSSIYLTNLNEALSKAKAGDYMLIEFTKPYCGGYKRFAEGVLDNFEVKEYLKNNFIAVALHPSRSTSLMKKYSIINVPTFIVTNHRGQELDRFVGYPDKEKFIKNIKDIMKSPINLYNLQTKSIMNQASKEDYFHLAEKYYNMKKYDEAEKNYNLSTGSIHDFEKNIGLGNIYLTKNNKVKADYYYSEAKKQNPKNKIVDYKAGYTAYMERQHETAIKYFESFLMSVRNLQEYKNDVFNAMYLSLVANVFLEKFSEAKNINEEIKNKFPERESLSVRLTDFIIEKENESVMDPHDEEHYHEGCGGLTEATTVKK